MAKNFSLTTPVVSVLINAKQPVDKARIGDEAFAGARAWRQYPAGGHSETLDDGGLA